ncbi:MAG: efflux RND transporter periplasmic adaptor subunit [Sphingomonadales bacterium]|jgi:multidrug efflux system membrane fusion protein
MIITASLLRRGAGLALVAGLGLSLSACSRDEEGGPGGRKRPPQLVAAQIAATENYAPTLVALGTVTPSQSVAVRPRADGEIIRIAFAEGASVRAGQVMFQLDARAAQAALQQARAALASATATEIQARGDFNRAQALVGKGFISGTVADQRRAAADAARAQIENARGAVKAAETQLSFLTVRAPISGRTGELGYRLGANVRAADATALVTINQLSPIHVRFLVPAENVQQARGLLAGGGGSVVAKERETGKIIATGRLVFLDNNIDPGNGAIAARAEFRNDGDMLWPGGIVDVEFPLAAATPHIALPESAVQTGRDTPFVWAIKAAGKPKGGAASAGPDAAGGGRAGGGKSGRGAGGKVEMRSVVVAGRLGGKVYLASGVTPGEKIVVDALARLRDGDMVRVKGPGKPPADGKPQMAAASGRRAG